MDIQPRSSSLINKLFFLFSGAALLAYALILIRFVAHDGLSSFATDSANYMVMARFLSPWHDASAAIVHAWPEQDYPVFFPLVLALLGAAYNYYAAHAITALFLVAALPLIFIYARKLELSRTTSSLIIVMLAISPAAWINSLGILSENLYLLLTLLTLLYYRRMREASSSNGLIFGLLLGLLVITRSIGICMLAAYALIAALQFFKTRQLALPALYAIGTAAVVIVLARLLHDASLPAQYIQQFGSLVSSGEVDAYRDYNLLLQITALVDAWFVSWLYYWNSNLILSYLMFVILGLLALAGLVMRLLKRELDAGYLLLYLLILIVWPHPGQSLRFIFPVQFLLLIFAAYALQQLLQPVQAGLRFKLQTLVLFFALVTIVPAQFYTWHRHQEGKTYGYQYYKEFYQLHDRDEALENAEIQAIMHRDLAGLRELTTMQDRIMYFIPAYVALLADRIALPIEFYQDAQNKIQLQRDEQADYVYLSSLHPRKTRRETNGLYIYVYFREWTSLIGASHLSGDGEAVSYLLKVNKE